MADIATNFAKTAVVGIYSAADSSVQVEDVGRFSTPPFNATWWNATDYSDPSDDPYREIVRVTAKTISGAVQTLTVTRGQEGTVATSKALIGKTYKVMAGLTAKMWNDFTTPGIGGSVPLRSNGSPEGVVTANAGTWCWDDDNDYLYFKKTGSGNTGWVAH